MPVPASAGLTYPLAGNLEGVSCPAVNTCVAFGFQTLANGQENQSVETWDGMSWSVRNTTGVDFDNNGVSCVSAAFCMLVGPDYAASWNGSTVTRLTTPIPSSADGQSIAGSSLQSVSCASADACVAVGWLSSDSAIDEEGWEDVPYAEVWNGATWTPDVAPLPPAPPEGQGYYGSEFDSVSCPSATFCVAVGTANGTAQTSIIDTWNGSTWSVVPLPASDVQQLYLYGISCSSSTSCVAVGSGESSSSQGVFYSEVWNGTSWSPEIVPSSATPGTAGEAVSCTSSTACTAVLSSGTVGGLVEEWNGESWSPQTTVSLPEAPGFADISCANPVSCMVVGTNRDLPPGTPLAELHQASGWSLTPPTLTAPEGSALDAVSCTSRTACTAVGSPTQGGGVIVERLTGRGWELQSAPSPIGAAVKAVSCTSATACTLVGFQDAGMLTERWNGQSWSLDSIGLPAQYDGLSAVSCTSASVCIAVGGGAQALSERWNGRSWSSESVPLPTEGLITQNGITASALTGISCRSSHRCVAVGTYEIDVDRGPDYTKPLAESWNGSRWALETPSPQTVLSTVSCPSTTDCNAVAQQWNGTSWSLGPDPNAVLNSISCMTADACTAVGSGRIDHWNGKRWMLEPSAPGLPAATFNAVSCISARSCVLVGSNRGANGLAVPLVERLG